MSGRGVAGSERADKRLSTLEKRTRRRNEEDLRFVMGTPQGRRFVFRLIDEMAGTFGLSMTGNSQTFFNEGRRSMGIDVMREAQALAPADYVHMLSEAFSQQQEDDVHRKSAEDSAETDE